jgi:hypothetical protein
MYTNLTNTQAKKLPLALQKKCIKLTDGTWDIKTSALPKSKNLQEKPTSKDSSREFAGIGAKNLEYFLPRKFSKRNMGEEPEYKNKKVVPAKRLGFF